MSKFEDSLLEKGKVSPTILTGMDGVEWLLANSFYHTITPRDVPGLRPGSNLLTKEQRKLLVEKCDEIDSDDWIISPAIPDESRRVMQVLIDIFGSNVISICISTGHPNLDKFFFKLGLLGCLIKGDDNEGVQVIGGDAWDIYTRLLKLTRLNRNFMGMDLLAWLKNETLKKQDKTNCLTNDSWNGIIGAHALYNTGLTLGAKDVCTIEEDKLKEGSFHRNGVKWFSLSHEQLKDYYYDTFLALNNYDAYREIIFDWVVQALPDNKDEVKEEPVVEQVSLQEMEKRTLEAFELGRITEEQKDNELAYIAAIRTSQETVPIPIPVPVAISDITEKDEDNENVEPSTEPETKTENEPDLPRQD